MRIFYCVLFIIGVSCLLADGVQPDGSGTQADPWQVATLDNLLWVSTNSTSWDDWFIQTADIDATDTQTWNDGAGFIPIGNQQEIFCGNYDGQYYNIDSLYIYRPNTDNVGFWGYVSYAHIHSVCLTNVNVTGNIYTGGLVGITYHATITNCSTSGIVQGEELTGGFMGNCHLTSYTSSCYSTCNVSGGISVGGFAGYCEDGFIFDCYCSGTATGEEYIGGFVGIVNRGVISNCYSRGWVEGTSYTGGFMSFVLNYLMLAHCFWNTQTSGQSTSAGGATGLTTLEMLTLSTYLNAGWSFMTETQDGTWGINYQENDGYPFLSWQGYEFDPVAVADDTVTPLQTHLLPAYPNPFNPSTTICFSVAQGQVAELSIYNTRGQRVCDWSNLAPGEHSVCWNGTDDDGRPVASGVYFYRLSTSAGSQTRKMMLLK